MATNNNIPGIDSPPFEQLWSAPAASAVGCAACDDNERYYYVVFSATAFWRWDTWACTWQQLPNLPGGTLAAGSCLRYVRQIGSQVLGFVGGSVFAFLAAGASVTYYRFDTASATWSGALSVVNIPAAWALDGRLMCPEPALNGFLGGYHSSVALNTITAGATAAINATSITVTALPLALPSGAVLNFGTAAAPIWAVTTAAAAAAATSITVSPLVAAVNSASVAYFYADMFLWGNNAQAGYRYNFATGLWYLTSANGGNPTIGTPAAAPGAGMVACWLPGSGDANALDRILLVRGAASSTIYEYSLTANTFSTLTYYPSTETFSTGTSSGIRSDANGKNRSLILMKDTAGAPSRAYELSRSTARMIPAFTQGLFASGTVLVGDRMSIIKTSGIEWAYMIPSTSSYFVRTPLFP